jgi:hypothetical protein
MGKGHSVTDAAARGINAGLADESPLLAGSYIVARGSRGGLRPEPWTGRLAIVRDLLPAICTGTFWIYDHDCQYLPDGQPRGAPARDH